MPQVILQIKAENLSKPALDQLKNDFQATINSIKSNNANAQIDMNTMNKKTEESFKALAFAMTAVTYASWKLLASVVESAMKYEQMKMSLISLTGSAALAERQLIRLREAAKLPGLTFQGAVEGAVKLTAVGLSASMAERTMIAFGNALATVGGGAPEMSGVLLALTQIKAKGRALAEEINQLADRFSMIRKVILDAFGTASTEQLAKYGISADLFISAIVTQLEKMPRITNTAQYSMKNFTDALLQHKMVVGEQLLPALKNVLGVLTSLTRAFINLPAPIQFVTSRVLVLVPALASLLAIGITIAMYAKKWAEGFAILSKAVWTSTNAYIAAGIALALLATYIYSAIKRSKDFGLQLTDFVKRADDYLESVKKMERTESLVNRLDELRKNTKLNADETRELVEIQNELVNLNPALLSKYDKEGNAIADNTTKLKEYVEWQKKSSAIEKAVTVGEAQSKYDEATKRRIDIEDKIIKLRDKLAIPTSRKSIVGALSISAGATTRQIQKLEIEHEKRKADEGTALDELNLLTGKMTRDEAKQDVESTKRGFQNRQSIVSETLSIRAKLIEDAMQEEIAVINDAFRKEEETTKGSIAQRQNQLKQNSKMSKELRKTTLGEIADYEENIDTKRQFRDKEIRDVHTKYAEKLTKDLEEETNKRLRHEQRLAEISNNIWKATRQNEIDAIVDKFDRERESAQFEFNQKNLDYRMKVKYDKITKDEQKKLHDELIVLEESKNIKIRAINKEEYEGIMENLHKIGIKKVEERDKEYADAVDMQSKLLNLQTKTTDILVDIIQEGYKKDRENVMSEYQKGLNDVENQKRDLGITDLYGEEITTGLNGDQTRFNILAIREFNKQKVSLVEKLKTDLNKIDQKETDDRNQRLIDEINDFLTNEKEKREKRKQEAKKLVDELIELQAIKTSLMKDGLKKELQEIKDKYDKERDLIDYSIKYEEMSDETKKTILTKRGLLVDAQKKEEKEAVIKHYEFLGDYIQKVLLLPSSIISLWRQTTQATKEAANQLRDIERENLDKIREVWDNEQSSAQEKVRRIEQIERESADRRLQIEQDLADKKAETLKKFVFDFFGDIAKQIEKLVVEKASLAFVTSFAGSQQEGTGFFAGLWDATKEMLPAAISMITSGGNPFNAVGGGVDLGSMNTSMLGLDNPRHDMLARVAGAKAFVSNASFDRVNNDLYSRLEGSRQASLALGMRSAQDLVNNFSVGFNESAKNISGNKNNTSSNVKLQVFLDGKELASSIKVIDDRESFMGNAR